MKYYSSQYVGQGSVGLYRHRAQRHQYIKVSSVYKTFKVILKSLYFLSLRLKNEHKIEALQKRSLTKEKPYKREALKNVNHEVRFAHWIGCLYSGLHIYHA